MRNKNTRRAYYKAACRFSDWCEGRGLFDLARVKPLHVAAYIEDLQRTHSKPTVKQHLAGLRMLFDWLVVGHVMDVNPAHSVRGPKHVMKKRQARILLDSIDTRYKRKVAQTHHCTGFSAIVLRRLPAVAAMSCGLLSSLCTVS